LLDESTCSKATAMNTLHGLAFLTINGVLLKSAICDWLIDDFNSWVADFDDDDDDD